MGIKELKKTVDTLIVIPNDRISLVVAGNMHFSLLLETPI